ncbi:MAG: hypothetical protein KAS07_01910 [Candidatus Pacebacteria bacterium]|nr:hypothetical protein [Candidatus Paceibacterota bacterium]
MHLSRKFLVLLVSSVMFAIYNVAVQAEEVKVISGMSIVGNNEAPKSLYIVPWKSSEIGMETDLSSNLLNESLTPVDKDVFLREVNFYNTSVRK